MTMSGRTSFTIVGHLIHISLKESLLIHKHDIGKALLLKNKQVLAVVNKVNTINNEYRNFDIEFIAKREGCDMKDEELLIVEVNENKCRYNFDFSKVYWNSRLSTEHERIIDEMNKHCDVVFDLCAGVGPFSIPAAKVQKCKVYANDLNPESVKWLQHNTKRNKVLDSVEIFNKDAREFIKQDLKEKLFHEYQVIEDEQLATMPKFHILMNLPAIALTFLPNFVGLFKQEHACNFKIAGQNLIDVFRKQNCTHIVYCYCFLKGQFDKPENEIRKLAEESIGRKLSDEQIVNIFRVRNVAPYKEMYRLMLKLDESILFDLEK